jgi:hypothetical protein
MSLLISFIIIPHAKDDKISLLRITGRINQDYPEVIFRIFSTCKNIGNHIYYNIQKIVISDDQNCEIQTITQPEVQENTMHNWLGQYHNSEGESIYTVNDCLIGGRQNWLYIQDVNFDNSNDIVIRNSCGTGGCSYSFYLFNKDTARYFYSPVFSQEAELIRHIEIDKKSRTISFFSGYQMYHEYNRYHVQKNNHLKLVYQKTETLDTKSLVYLYKEWTLTADRLQVKRSWQVKDPDGKGSTFFPVRPPEKYIEH